MDYLMIWAKNIVYYLLFTRLLLSFIPTGKTKKIVKLFIGIILIIFLISPILKVKDLDDEIVSEFINLSIISSEKQLKNNLEKYEGINEDIAMDIYESNIIENIKEIVNDENMHITDIQVHINKDIEDSRYLQIEEIQLNIKMGEYSISENVIIEEITIDNVQEETITGKSAEDLLIEKTIKNKLFNFYNIPSDNIHINIIY